MTTPDARSSYDDRTRPTSGFTRRDLLAGVAAVLGASALGTSTSARRALADLWDTRSVAATLGPTLPAGTPVVVVIELTGANDILNTIVPIDVAGITGHYRGARPSIGITQMHTARPYSRALNDHDGPPALALRDGWGLHGGLAFLANRFHDRGDVAIVQGTGENVQREMSHFAAMAYRWAGAFTGPFMATGWLGRYNDLVNAGQPLGAISLTGLHASLSGVNSPAVALGDLDTFGFSLGDVPDAARARTDLEGLGAASSSGRNKIATASLALHQAHQAVATAKSVTKLPTGGGTLGAQLSTAASLIRAGIPCQTYVATHGGFDLHGSEPWNHWDRLVALDAGLTHFFSLIDGTDRAGDVFVVLTSEFGRQVTENSGIGTDHGLGSSTIVVGGGVRGGFYGEHPAMASGARWYDALVPTVDFRSVYATVIDRLGNDRGVTDAAIGRDESGNTFPNLGFFGAAAPTPGGGSGPAINGPATATQPAVRLGVVDGA